MCRRPVVLAVMLAAMLVAGCAGSQAESNDTGRSFTAADVDFAIQMQAHHQQALVMTEMAADHATDSRVRKLAEEITTAQGREIDVMAGWIKRWAKQGAKLPGHGDSHAAHGPGMLSEADTARLGRASGKRFDHMWLRLMIEHHQGALDLARDEISDGRSVAAKRLARDVLRTQRTEIDQMRTMLGTP